MRITRTPTRLLWEGRLIRYLKGLSNQHILEIGAATNSYKKYCDPTNTLVRTDVKKTPTVDKVEDVTKLSFKNETFDTVVLSNVLEHVYDFQKAVDECRRVLKKKGTLVVIVPYLFPLHDKPHDYWRFSEFALRKILTDFSSLELHPIGVKRLPFYYVVFATK